MRQSIAVRGTPEQGKSEPSQELRDLANRITRWREAAGLRKIDLARALEVEPSMVSKWERAQMQPRIDNIHRIAEACGVSLRIFWGQLPGGGDADESD